MITGGDIRWLEDHYSFFKKDITTLEADVYANIPQALWKLGFASCLWAYVLSLQNSSTGRLRGAANDNSWFKNPYGRLPLRRARLPHLLRLPTIKFHPLKKVARFRQWQSEKEFCALLPDLYRPPTKSADGERD